MNPWIVENVILPMHEKALRRNTIKRYHELLDQQWWPTKKLHQLQLARLQKLVSIATFDTDAYRRLTGLNPVWIPQKLLDLQKLPLLDKTIISANRDQLINKSVRGGPIRYTTGGSSGKPLIFYFDKRRQACDKAARMLTHHWWSIQSGDREAYLWGAPVELNNQDRAKEFRDRLTNQLLLSAFDLSQQSVGWFVDQLRSFGPKCLFGYPSSIDLLCRLARRAGLDLRDLPVKVVFSTAEVLYDHQKQTISQAFVGAAVVNGYGSREGGFIAHECPLGRMHIISPHVIVEFLRNGSPVQAGEEGEIVITHLENHAMPFIRYRTGDVGRPSHEPCPCGRGLETMNVVMGRTTDFLLTSDGRWIHGLALIYTVREIPGVIEYQIIQSDLDAVTVKLVTDKAFPTDAPDCIAEGVKQRLGQDTRVTLEFPESIPTAPSGKYRYVISYPARDALAELEAPPT